MSTNLQPPDGVPLEVWRTLATDEGARWAIAERNADGEIVGTAYRLPDGTKDFKKGGKRGLIFASPFDAYAGTATDDPVFVCEGASDTAAMLGIGLEAVGIPMAGQCGEWLAALLRGRHAVVVADADEAGTRGTDKIVGALMPDGASVRRIVPPKGAKDARAAIIDGAKAGDFLALAKAATVLRPASVPKPGGVCAAKRERAVAVKPPNQSEQLVGLALKVFRLGQTPKREPFAVLIGGANVALRLSGSGGPLRDVLAREYRRGFQRVMSANAFTNAIGTLRGEAMEAPAEPVFLRVGPHAGGIVLDLGTADGAAVVVDADGWRVVDRSPILFQRTALTGALPIPTRGGDLADLRALLNVTDETWPILLGWIVAGFLPDMPHPVLMLGGQQGSGKTTAARFVCGLFDPSDAPTRSQPRDPETWAISVANGWSAVIDNVSSIPDWLSDALCKCVTGDGWVRRMLYTDTDISVLSFRRVVALTSIDAGALRGDLGERLVLVDLEPIAPQRRTTERELEARYATMRAALLGALLDVLSKVLARLDSAMVPELPRMADFARVLAALDDAIGTDALRLYCNQGKRIAGDVLDADPVGDAIARFARDRVEWRGTAGELLKAIKPENAGREWPRHPRGLTATLKRLAPALALQGVRVTVPRETDRTRTYSLSATAQTARPPESACDADATRDNCRAVGLPAMVNRAGDRPSSIVDPDAANAAFGLLGGSGDLYEPDRLGPTPGTGNAEVIL